MKNPFGNSDPELTDAVMAAGNAAMRLWLNPPPMKPASDDIIMEIAAAFGIDPSEVRASPNNPKENK